MDITITIEKDLEESDEEPRYRRKFIIQLVCLFLVLVGAGVGLVLNKTQLDVNDLLIGIIFSIGGLFLPQPKMK